MELNEQSKVESVALDDFVRVMEAGTSMPEGVDPKSQEKGGRLNLDPTNVKNGIGQLVLTLVKLLHEILERQAIRRINAGSLSDDEIEDVGVALMRQSEELERLCLEFGLVEDDLNLDLGPLGKLL
ncbi:MAG: gas vesicle protein K [Desulfobacterales bacterium]|jgi:hypothetical protein